MSRKVKDEASGKIAPKATVLEEGKPGRKPGPLPNRWISWMDPMSSAVMGSIEPPHRLSLRYVALSEISVESMRDLGAPSEMYELIQSVSDLGLIESPVVVPRAQGGYELVAGFRRFLASLVLAEYRAVHERPDARRARGVDVFRKTLRAESREMKENGLGFVNSNGKSDGIPEWQIDVEVRGARVLEDEQSEQVLAIVSRTKIPVVVHQGASEEWVRLARQHENIVRKAYSPKETKGFALGRSGPRALSQHYMPVDVADQLERRYRGAIPLWERVLGHLQRMQSGLNP